MGEGISGLRGLVLGVGFEGIRVRNDRKNYEVGTKA